jgi:hypothetical protein
MPRSEDTQANSSRYPIAGVESHRRFRDRDPEVFTRKGETQLASRTEGNSEVRELGHRDDGLALALLG